MYAKKFDNADFAGDNAAKAFQWLTGIEYYELFKNLHKQDV